MPIKKNNRNHDFEWEFEPQEEGQEFISYTLRLHHTDAYGPTMSFLDPENNNVAFSVPIEMLSDVIEEYQRWDRIVNESNRVPVVAPNAISSAISAQNITLPRIQKSTNISQPANQTATQPSIDVPEEGFESFTQEKAANASAPSPKSNEEILEERGKTADARKAPRPKNNKKSIKSSHKIIEDE